MRFLRKGKTRITAEFCRTDLVVFSHSREGKTRSYNQINTVLIHLIATCFTLLHSEQPKFNSVLALLSAIRLRSYIVITKWVHCYNQSSREDKG